MLFGRSEPLIISRQTTKRRTAKESEEGFFINIDANAIHKQRNTCSIHEDECECVKMKQRPQINLAKAEYVTERGPFCSVQPFSVWLRCNNLAIRPAFGLEAVKTLAYKNGAPILPAITM